MLRGALGMLGLLVSLTTSRDMGPHLAAPETAASTAEVATAPDFALATAWGWHSFREIRAERPVVLVFGADDAALATIEKELPALEARGVEVAAVTGDSDGANWERIERLGLHYALWSDPRAHLAGLFGVDTSARAWCLIDTEGRIAGLRRGVSPQDLAGEVERALPAAVTAGGDEMR